MEENQNLRSLPVIDFLKLFKASSRILFLDVFHDH